MACQSPSIQQEASVSEDSGEELSGSSSHFGTGAAKKTVIQTANNMTLEDFSNEQPVAKANNHEQQKTSDYEASSDEDERKNDEPEAKLESEDDGFELDGDDKGPVKDDAKVGKGAIKKRAAAKKIYSTTSTENLCTSGAQQACALDRARVSQHSQLTNKPTSLRYFPGCYKMQK